MSDSDDTDILLLIPPNYYMNNVEEQFLLDDLKISQLNQFSSFQQLQLLELEHKLRMPSRIRVMDLGCCNYNLMMPPPTKKTELNHFNVQLHNIERNNVAATSDCPLDIYNISANPGKTQYAPGKVNMEDADMLDLAFKKQLIMKKHHDFNQEEMVSDMSSISTSTMGIQFDRKIENKDLVGMVHSTPKTIISPLKKQATAKHPEKIQKESVLSQSDDGITNGDLYWQKGHSDANRLKQQLEGNVFSHVSDNFLAAIGKTEESRCFQMSKTDNNLISLSEIWGKSGQATAIAKSLQSNLKEEQLRRQHLEKTVRHLQVRLLEYQQRLSVAIEVDRTKDNALHNAQVENDSLKQEFYAVRKSLHEFEQHRKTYDDKLETLQKELAQAVSLASKFQQKTEKLEEEILNCSKKTNESCNQYKQKIEELQIKINACKRSEELAINQLHKLREKCSSSEQLYEKAKIRCEELEKENSTLKGQKDMLQEYHQKQKNRAENLDLQRKSLQESLANLTENENSLRKKLDLQQKTLKCHYQQQLENVVSQKLKEFQEQLDKTEETFKAEARERERLIAERAVKQLELINEKNELELNLLQEKHNEEVELYRIQLANASKKIDDMEMKLNVYKSKRADIAEKLHNVMETQWQKALEILISPHNNTQTTNNETDLEPLSPEDNQRHNKAICHTNVNKENKFETPKSNNNENNFNLMQKQETLPMDKFQAYIELLLSKSPTDFDKLDEILALTSKAKDSKDKMEKSAKKYFQSKPPWKA